MRKIDVSFIITIEKIPVNDLAKRIGVEVNSMP